MSAAIWGMTPLITTSSRNRWPEPANSDPTASWIRAPAESSSHTNGIRWVSASSRSRPTLISPVIPIAPAMTVKSYAHTATIHRALGEVRLRVDPQLGERPLVDQQRDPLARRQLARLVLARDLLLAAP